MRGIVLRNIKDNSLKLYISNVALDRYKHYYYGPKPSERSITFIFLNLITTDMVPKRYDSEEYQKFDFNGWTKKSTRRIRYVTRLLLWSRACGYWNIKRI